MGSSGGKDFWGPGLQRAGFQGLEMEILGEGLQEARFGGLGRDGGKAPEAGGDTSQSLP